MIMKKAFTLVELLVVIGLMGLMGSIAVAGYSAVVRGMSDRAAIDAAKGVVDAAVQRANLDGTATYLYLFNEVTKIDSDMAPGAASGLIIAVRPVGRISAVVNGLYCDEFADLQNSYRSLDSENETTSQSDAEARAASMRIYSIADQKYAMVKEGVFQEGPQYNSCLESGDGIDEWHSRKFYYYGFKRDTSGSSSGSEANATFKAGQEYGKEFAEVRLPDGYTFSTDVNMSSRDNLGQHLFKVVKILPTGTSAPGIEVFRRKPDGSFESIGRTNESEDGE